MSNSASREKGFTIVELLIVVVVIAILAAITIVTYSNMQKRARDSQRKSDIAYIRKSLEMYKLDNNGNYPATVPNPGSSTWEISTDPGFMNSLSTYTSNKTIVAPSGSVYKYHWFAAGTQGCSASQGPFYALWVQGMETQSSFYRDVGGCTGSTLLPVGSAYDTPSNYLILGF